MIDRREVMLKAWADFKSMNARPAHETRGFDISFSACLKFSWKIHKQAAANLAAEMKEAMHPNAPAIRAIKKALEELTYKPFGHRIVAERRSLEARLSALTN